MKKVYFRYKIHPRDFFRSTDVIELPNANENFEEFLIWFLDNYQSDDRIAYLDDLYKLLYNEYSNENDKFSFIKQIGCNTENEIREEINLRENKLKEEAYKNFYNLLLTNQIEILNNYEEQ